ncbi:hypothetical protein [Methylobacterium tarhaniae]|uniref:hypothetical protein n=1 Tax=Methylobacterium tarhaniae TaxID=1187852 RepID=UPI003CFCC451
MSGSAVLIVSLLAVLFINKAAFAQVELCGPAPSFTLTKEEVERVKGDAEGKVKLFSKLLGDAGLKGALEAERKKIYQDNPEFAAKQKDAYLFYITCVILMQDSSLNSNQKIDQLIRVQDTFRKNISTITIPKKYEELSKLNSLLDPEKLLSRSGVNDIPELNSKYLFWVFASNVHHIDSATDSIFSKGTVAVPLKELKIYEEIPESGEPDPDDKVGSESSCPGKDADEVMPLALQPKKVSEYLDDLQEYRNSLYIEDSIKISLDEFMDMLKNQVVIVGCKNSDLLPSLSENFPKTKSGKFRIQKVLSGESLPGGMNWAQNRLLETIQGDKLKDTASSIQDKIRFSIKSATGN